VSTQRIQTPKIHRTALPGELLETVYPQLLGTTVRVTDGVAPIDDATSRANSEVQGQGPTLEDLIRIRGAQCRGWDLAVAMHGQHIVVEIGHDDHRSKEDEPDHEDAKREGQDVVGRIGRGEKAANDAAVSNAASPRPSV
jgi:hypothetical protein